MAKDNSNSFNSNSPLLREPGLNKSFVKKVRSRMSGLLPTSLSKWFSKESDDSNKSTVRPREEDDDDDEYYSIQPPTKRVKMPTPPATAAATTSFQNNRHMNSVLHTNFKINDTNSRIGSAITGDNQNKFDFTNSTLSEPTAGTSGVVTSKELFSTINYNNLTDNLLNGDRDSESGESVSGHSSSARISHKNVSSSKELEKNEQSTPNIHPNSLLNTSYRGQTRSLFTERSLSPQINSSLSSRRPSFSASTFGSPNFIDRTLFTKRIINSPFYNGRTTYGGASAYNFHKGRSPSTSAKSQIHAKPVNQSVRNDNATLSKTARRILDTLEQYSTPISDAKKIPNPLVKRPRQEGLLSKYTGANPYLMREHRAPSASNKELQIPTVPDLLKMKLKERLQDSTVAVRQIATSSRSSLNSNEYKIKNVEDETPKYTNKMKTKVSSVRQKPENEVVEEVKLPEITLPITTLPKFDFSLPLPVSSSKPLITVAYNDNNKPTVKISGSTGGSQKAMVMSEPRKSISETTEYTFSNPLVLAENLVSIIAINDFKFSDPVCKQKDYSNKTSSEIPFVNFKSSDSSSNVLKPTEVAPTFNFKTPDSSNLVLKKKNQDNSELLKPPPVLLTGSVDDIFTNKQEKEKKPEPSTSTSLNLLDKFKPAAGTWECSSCLIRNTSDKQKCIACETPKDKSGSIVNANKKVEEKKPEPSTSTSLNLLDKFKPAAGTWECSSCLIRNTSDKQRCIACETPKDKSGSIVNANKKVEALETVKDVWNSWSSTTSSTWECPTCMIRNKDETEKCEACETSKPGGSANKRKLDSTNIKDDAPKFKFGFFPGFQDSSNAATMNEEMKITSAATLISTLTTTAAPIPTFTFGIPSKSFESKEALKDSKGIIFKSPEKLPDKTEITITTTTNVQGGFLFGSNTKSSAGSTATAPIKVTEIIKPESQPEKKSTPIAAIPTTGFAFGANNNTKNPLQTANQPDSNTKANDTLPKIVSTTSSTPLAGFTFNATSPLKGTLNATGLQPKTDVKKNAPIATTPLLFNPPKQPLLNKADLNILNKPSFPLSTASPSKVDNNNIFGSVATSVTTQIQPANASFTFTPTPSSVLPTSSTSTVTSPNIFGFGAKTPSSTTPLFGNTTTTTTTAAEASTFKFGSPATTSSNTNQTGFGLNMQPAASNPFGTSNPTSSIFGAGNKPIFETLSTPAPSSGFSAPKSEIKFGNPVNETISQPPKPVAAFTFGQALKPAELPKPVFNFGGSTVPSSTPVAGSGGFSFNANTNPVAPNMNFNFNPPKMDNPTPFQSPPSNIFSPQNPMPTLQQPQTQSLQNGGFNFGAAPVNNNAKTGFNFGMTQTPQFNQPQQPVAPAAASAGPPGMFSFGAPNPNAAPAAGGFNFNAGPPTFNANIKPTFNFTGGATPTFSAQPSDNPNVAQRKKIRAVRRQR